MAAFPEASVILTRPQDKNQALAARAEAAGMQALCLPALRISASASPGLDVPMPAGYDLVVFVSSRAVALYMAMLAQTPGAGRWPGTTLAAAVGWASASAVIATGAVSPGNVLHPAAAQPQDSEHLWPLIEAKLGRIRRALIVRGERGREWLGARLERAGVAVDRFAVYRREAACWSQRQGEQLARALTSGRPCVCVLTSSESVDAVFANICRLGLKQAWSQCRFVVIHERIGDRLQSLIRVSGQRAPSMVKLCQPDDDAIFQAILRAASP